MDFDFRHVLDTPGLDVQFFDATHQNAAATSSTEWQVWTKPKDARMIYMFALGGGGAGASPTALTPFTSCYGGGAGGPSATISFMIPAFFCPDQLWVQVGQGGKGSNTGAGAAGLQTFVAVEPFNQALANANIWTMLGASGGAGGAVNGAGGAEAVGSAPQWCKKGHLTATNAQVVSANGGGVGGVNNAVGFSSPWSQSGTITMGGGGGGGQGGIGTGTSNTGNGGSIILPYTNDFWPSAPNGGIGGNTTVNATNGDPGYSAAYFMVNMGGAGGGASAGNTFGVAGTGGNGARGSGGGGGGGGTNAATRGRGGDGGDGLLYVISW